MAAGLFLLFGVAQAVAAWHASRGVDRAGTTIAADWVTPTNAGHADDGCALCSTAVHPNFPVVVTLVAVQAVPRASWPLRMLLPPLAHIELGTNGPRAPPVG